MKLSPDLITPEAAPTLSQLLHERALRSPHHVAYRYCNRMTGKWHSITWGEMQQRVALWRSALMQENLEPGERIAIMLPNCPEWICMDLAAHTLGLIVVPLYLNDRAENVAYILEDTQAKVFACLGITCWEHLEPVFDRLAGLQRIITIDFCNSIKDEPRIACISDWLPDTPAPAPHFQPAPDDTATIVYTSGTTGPPKGVMLSHRNMISNAFAGLQCIDIFRQDVFLSFLPLSHMLERTVGYYLPMMAGATVAFARSIPELAEDMLTVRPTVLVAVPRIFERIHNGMKEKIEKAPVPMQKLFETAVEVGWHQFEYNQKRAAWNPTLLLLPLLDALIARKVRAKLGGKLRVVVSGGAPLSPDIAKVFIGLGLPIYQGYGLTETSPVVSVNVVENNNPKGVGLPLPGVEVKIGPSDELLVRGSCVMKGYWKRQDATADTIDAKGWLHTGDRAALVDGHIQITGRLKEIIVLSNGEKVSPSDVEQAISMDPLFEQSMVIGDGRPHLVLVAVLAKARWQMLAEELGISPDENSLKEEVVQQAILRRVEKLMHNLPGYAFIKQVVLTLEPWTVEHGLLTPTLKIRRKSVMQHMQDEIDALYNA